MRYMAKPLMLRDEDDERIETLKRRLRARSKVEVVRSGLDLLEREADRRQRIARWRRAAGLARESSLEFLREVRPHSRLSRLG